MAPNSRLALMTWPAEVELELRRLHDLEAEHLRAVIRLDRPAPADVRRQRAQAIRGQ